MDEPCGRVRCRHLADTGDHAVNDASECVDLVRPDVEPREWVPQRRPLTSKGPEFDGKRCEEPHLQRSPTFGGGLILARKLTGTASRGQSIVLVHGSAAESSCPQGVAPG